MKKLYIETSVVSYAASEISKDIIIAAHQILTSEMWNKLSNFDVYISEIVIDEISNGNKENAIKRLKVVEDFKILELTNEVENFAYTLITRKLIPDKCPEDALHIAFAAVNNIDFIVTWNFKHINNINIKNKIRLLAEESGFAPPVICSPEELIG